MSNTVVVKRSAKVRANEQDQFSVHPALVKVRSGEMYRLDTNKGPLYLGDTHAAWKSHQQDEASLKLWCAITKGLDAATADDYATLEVSQVTKVTKVEKPKTVKKVEATGTKIEIDC